MLKKRKNMYAQHHQVFDASTEKKHQSSYIWAERTAKVLVMVGVFGMAASSFAATPEAISVNQFDKTKPAIAQAKGFNEKIEDKVPDYSKKKLSKEQQVKDNSADKRQIASAIKERRKAVEAAMQISPDKVSEAALPKDIVDKLPEDLKTEVEKPAEVKGVWVPGVAELADGKHREVATMEVDDGSTVFVSGKQIPRIGSMRRVKVSGVELGNRIAIDSFEDVKVVPLATSKKSSPISLASKTGVTNKANAVNLASTDDFGLTMRLFDNKDLTNEKTTIIDRNIYHEWGSGGPTGVDPDTFSVRWEGFIQVPTDGEWQFHTVSDDGVRVWIDGKLIINNWSDHPVTTDTSPKITMTANSHSTIRVEYYEQYWNAVMQLKWTGPAGSNRVNQTIPASAFSHDTTTDDPTYVTCDYSDNFYSNDTAENDPLSCSYTMDGNLLENNPYPTTDANNANKILVIPVRLQGSEVPFNPSTVSDYKPEDFKRIINNGVSTYYAMNSNNSLHLKADVSDWKQLDMRASCDNRYDDEDLTSDLRRMVNDPSDPNYLNATGYQYVSYMIADVTCRKDVDNAVAYAAYGVAYPGRLNPSYFFLDNLVAGQLNNPSTWLVDSVDEKILEGVIIHELGHSMGLEHAHSGCATAAQAACSEEEAEYGNPYSPMGNAADYEYMLGTQDEFKQSHFSAYEKYRVGWLGSSNFIDVTSTSTITINRTDTGNSGAKGVRIPTENYDPETDTYFYTALIAEYAPPNEKSDTGITIYEVQGAGVNYLLNGRHDSEWNYHKAALKLDQVYRYSGNSGTSTDICIRVDEISLYQATLTVSPGCNFTKLSPYTSLGSYTKDFKYLGAPQNGTTETEPTHIVSPTDSCVIDDDLFVADNTRILRFPLAADGMFSWPNTNVGRYQPSLLKASSAIGADNTTKWRDMGNGTTVSRQPDTFYYRAALAKPVTLSAFPSPASKTLYVSTRLSCDQSGKNLFAAQNTSNASKVSVFDVSSVKNGPEPKYVIGQSAPSYTSSPGATTTVLSTLFQQPAPPIGSQTLGGSARTLYSWSQKLLFAIDSVNKRILVFDLSAGGGNFMAARYVIGQSSFTANGTTGLAPDGFGAVALDDAGKRLFVSAKIGTTYKIMVFDTANLSNNASPKVTFAGIGVGTMMYDARTKSLLAVKDKKVYLYDASPDKLTANSKSTTTYDLATTANFSSTIFDSKRRSIVATSYQQGSGERKASVLFFRLPEKNVWKSPFTSR